METAVYASKNPKPEMLAEVQRLRTQKQQMEAAAGITSAAPSTSPGTKVIDFNKIGQK